MNDWGRLAALAIGLGLATACAHLGSPNSVEKADLEPTGVEEKIEALARLGEMSHFLASQPTLRFEAEIHYDAVQPSGQKIEFGSHRRVAFASPNRARIEITHWDGGFELITFDGKRVSASVPELRAYASIDYEGRVGAAFDHLDEQYGAGSPLLDLVRRDLEMDLAPKVLSGRFVATVTIEGVPCDQLAFTAKRLDFQIFIRQGEEPFPMRMVVDYHADEGRPQFRAQMHDWELASELPSDLFRFSPPAGAERLGFPELLDRLLGPVEAPEGGR